MGREVIKEKLGLGGVAIGNGFKVLSDKEADKTLEAAWDAGIRYYDTSPWYGLGLSERRFGHFLHNKKKDDYILTTKVGRVLSATKNILETMWNEPAPFDYKYDYSAKAVRRSIEDSLQRLGIESIDYVFIHDLSPDHNDEYKDGTTWLDHFEVARKGAMPELTKMREEGLIKGWGLGVNTIEPIVKTLEETDADPDIFLSAIQYSLVDHKKSLDELFPSIEKHNVGLITAAPFNAGLLSGQDRYNYSGDMPEEKVKRLNGIKEIAKKHNVDLSTASLQFSYAPKIVNTVLAGASKPKQVQENAKAFDIKIPSQFWEDLKKENLIDERAEVPE
ncbi:aldo/keto reductase [Christiangramia echinicola]|uniref:D-threo-aldose 1-dehydrogenase n=1 Tax=Christiangramia echinicola TaxID=279359 RepID=A0A1H1KV62_9FLAO|nr:aldo/keto reductase [Christiangramia echinicola]SDR65675.1 D-threo-aldose 1-dehydrogenase [Christiangramia echinicola]